MKWTPFLDRDKCRILEEADEEVGKEWRGSGSNRGAGFEEL
jgi:hypothetical protein